MSEVITAVYENGVLRPVNPVSLTEGQTVRLRLETESEPRDVKAELEKLLDRLAAEGILRQQPKQSQADPEVEKKWREVFENLKERPGKLASEIIIEERGPW